MSTIIADSCVLCGSTNSTVLCEFPELTWVSCNCGLIYKRSQDAPAVEYHEGYFISRENVRRHYNTRERRRVRKSRSQILDVLNHVEPGPLLDVGCSRGYALRAASDLGLKPTGVDVSEYAVGYCSELGFTTKRGTIDRLPFADAAFQIVIMKHVLEHTADPRGALAEVRRVLRPGGGLFIAVPHAGYIKARANPTKSRFFMPEFPGGREHFVYYTPRTLSRLLEEEFFRTVRVHSPHLLHQHANGFGRLAELTISPFGWAFHRAKKALALHKEFWVISTR